MTQPAQDLPIRLHDDRLPTQRPEHAITLGIHDHTAAINRERAVIRGFNR